MLVCSAQLAPDISLLQDDFYFSPPENYVKPSLQVLAQFVFKHLQHLQRQDLPSVDGGDVRTEDMYAELQSRFPIFVDFFFRFFFTKTKNWRGATEEMHAELQALNVLAFASTKVQILTQEEEGRVRHITCFTSTKVQILTQPEGSSVQQIFIEFLREHAADIAELQSLVQAPTKTFYIAPLYYCFTTCAHAADIAELQSRVQALTKTFSMAVTKLH